MGYRDHSTESLYTLLATERRNFETVSQQLAIYGSLDAPPHLFQRRQEHQTAIAELEAELHRRGEALPDGSQAPQSPSSSDSHKTHLPQFTTTTKGSHNTTYNSTVVFVIFALVIGVVAVAGYYFLANKNDAPAPNAQTLVRPTVTLLDPPTPAIPTATTTAMNQWKIQLYANTNLDGSPQLTTAIAGIANNKRGYAYAYNPAAFPSPPPQEQRSMRLLGTFMFDAGRYHFHCQYGGCRVNVEQKNIIEAWYEGSDGHDQTITLSAGMHTVMVEHFSKSGQDGLEVMWEQVDNSP